MHEFNVLLTFTGGLTAALILGYVAQRIRLSPIVGYLIAGIVVGPFTPGFIAHQAVAEQFAEIGIILLLFGIGLRFNLEELFAVWKIAVPGALIQSVFTTIAMMALMQLFGWTWNSGLVLGLAISVASTVVMAFVLGERRDLYAPIGHIAIGWTVVEDILTVIYLLLLPILFSGDPDSVAGQSAGWTLMITLFKILGLLASVVILGRWVIPWILERIARTRSRELFTLSVLVLALGIAIGSSEIFGVSMALGAFLAGLVVGRTEFAARAGNDALPMRDAFAILFFVSVGMLFDPGSLLDNPLLIAAVLVVVLIGKPLSTLLTVWFLGKPLSTAIPVGAALSQVGEFSFILGVVARELNLLSDAGWNAMIAVSIISIALNPAVYGFARRFSAQKSKLVPQTDHNLEVDPRKCILIGYGPVGKIVYRILTEQGAIVTIIELNLETVRKLRLEGINAIYGDVLRQGTLEEAGIAVSSSLIISTDIEDAVEIVRYSRTYNPYLRVLVRCAHLRDVSVLHDAGATVVAAGEAEVAVALAEAVTNEADKDHSDIVAQSSAIRTRLYNSSAH